MVLSRGNGDDAMIPNLSPEFNPGLTAIISMQSIPADYFYSPYWFLQVLCLVFGLFGILLGWWIHSRQWWFEKLITKYLEGNGRV